MQTNKNIDQDEDGNILPSINKENSFSAPGDYFERLPSKITNRVQSGQNKSFVIKPVFSISVLAAAACLALLFIFYSRDETISADEFALSETDIDYILENPEVCNLDPFDISDAYLSMVSPDQDEDLEDPSIPDDAIESYLQENTDLSIIINNEP